MIRLLKLLGGAARSIIGTLDLHRAWITFVLVAAAAAFLWSQYARVSAQRDRLAGWIDIACASAGTPWLVTADAPRTLQPGQICQLRIAALSKFEADTARASAAALAAAAVARDAKTVTDTHAARRNTAKARATTVRMETIDAQLKTDHVSADWFAAFNDAAGLVQPAP